MIKKNSHQSLNKICRKSSLFITIITVMCLLTLSWFILIQNNRQNILRTSDRLKTLAPLAERAIVGEIMVENSKFIPSILDELKKRFGFSMIQLSDKKLECAIEDSPSIFKIQNNVCMSNPISLESNYYLKLELPVQPISFYEIIKLLLWGSVPLIFLSIFITLLIQRKLKKAIVLPMENIAKNPQKWIAKAGVAREAIEVHKQLLAYINQQAKHRDEVEKLRLQSSIGKITAQVAHDIHSPLSALSILVNILPNISPEHKNIIKHATNRINDIANNLIIAYKGGEQGTNLTDSDQLTPEHIVTALNNIINEKKYQYRTKPLKFAFSIELNAYCSFAMINLMEFLRVVSNLINNSVESISGNGNVSVNLSNTAGSLSIEICDDGCGISETTLNKIKNNASKGLGIPHAIQNIGLWNGRYDVKTTLDKGTCFVMTLPRIEPPEWFLPKLIIKPDTNIVILDDDVSVLEAWKSRLESLCLDSSCPKHNVMTFSKIEEFIHHQVDFEKSTSIYLIDYDINSHSNGLDIIEKLKITCCSVLVTCLHEDMNIRNRCINLGVKIIPKTYLNQIPIEILTNMSIKSG